MRRPASVFGFTVLFAVMLLFVCGKLTVYIILAVSTLLCAVLGFMRKKHGFFTLLTVSVALCASIVSFDTAYRVKYEPTKAFDSKTVTFYGTAADFTETTGDYTAVKLLNCVSGEADIGGVTLYGKELPTIHPGDSVTVENATLTGVDENSVFFLHSLSKNSFHSVFSYENMSVRQGKRSGIIYSIMLLRREVSNRLRLSLSKQAFPIADALITGRRAELPSDFMNGLRVSGASHIFAVSGMHLSVWTVVLFSVFGSRFFAGRILSFAGILFVLFFVVFTGGSPSVIRAGIMLITAFAGNFLRKPSDSLNSLGLSSAIYILINPFAVGNVSFLLSFFATAAVIVTGEFVSVKVINVNLPFLVRGHSFVLGSLIASVTVTVFTLPVLVYFFGTASLLSGISSVLCTIPTECVMVSGVLGTLIFGTGSLSVFPFFVCELFAKLILKIVNFLSELDFFIIPLDWKTTTAFCVLVFIAATVTAVITSFNKKAVVASFLACIAVGLSCTLIFDSFKPPQTEIFISGGSSGDILISENGGASTVVFGLSGTYRSVSSVKREMAKSGRTDTDLLILVPGVQYKSRFDTEYSPKSTIYKDGTLLSAEQYAEIKRVSYSLSDKTTLIYVHENGFCGCLCISENIKTAFVFSGKRYDLPSDFLDSDIIVFRYGIPENAKESRSRKIMLSSYKADNALYAKTTGGIKITLKQRSENHADN